MQNEIVLDIETKKSFQEVGGKGNMHLLGVSVVGTYSYEDDTFRAFVESEFSELEHLLRSAVRVIGFNSKHFDFPVLQPHIAFNLREVLHLDLMEDVEQHLGFRVSLDNLAHTSLGAAKSAHGMQAIEWWREGNVEAIKKYCIDDVRITRDLYEYGKKHGKVFCEARESMGNKTEVPVAWTLAADHPVFTQPKLF